MAYLPGALLFRAPVLDRARRAALSAEERTFWSLTLSVVVSSSVALALAAANAYRFNRLLGIDAVICAAILVLGRGRLRLADAAPRPTWSALLPAGLVLLGVAVDAHVPPSEYIMGGKDPGVYINEGIQIAQRGTLTIQDDLVRTVPAAYRDLFFPPRGETGYYSNRFMGFFLLDPGSGRVVGQFPHLYPIWIAIAYGLDGLTGARLVGDAAAVFGLLAVYFLGARLGGRTTGAAAAALLAVHVLQVWYARYPNAEIVLQPLVLAALLAYTRSQSDNDRFFAPVAALLLALAIFAHITGVVAVAGVALAAVAGGLAGRPIRSLFGVPLVAGCALAWVYLSRVLPAYFALPFLFTQGQLGNRRFLIVVVALLLAALAIWRQPPHARAVLAAWLRTWWPAGLVAAVWLGAVYGYVFRHATGLLAPQDADALRTFTSFYFTPYGLALVLLGLLVLLYRSPDASAPLAFTFALFAFTFFYKMRIIPEHFWAGRRFLAVVLPGGILLVAAAAFADLQAAGPRFAWFRGRRANLVRRAIGTLVILALGWRFVSATRPIISYVEYAGLIPQLERLAGLFDDNDLVIVEARNASDVHVLALPLAYIYARHVLVLPRTDPDRQTFRLFGLWALGRYQRIFFVGGGGTELLSRSLSVRPVLSERFQIPEYASPLNRYPNEIRHKEFDLSVYELLFSPTPPTGFDLDVGQADDLFVRRFFAKETDARGVTFRWTSNVSFVSILGTRPDQQELTLTMGAGGRPATAPPADVQVFLNDRLLGRVVVRGPFSRYRFAVPPDLAAAVAGSNDAAELRLVTRAWKPSMLGGPDTRELGVMVDRIQLR